MSISPTFVYGVLDVRDRLHDATLGERCRELTFAWSRWSYAGSMIEHSDPDQLLALATERGVRYCLVQACGHLVIETLRPKGAAAPELVELLIAALGDDAWLVGRKVSANSIHDACWLVDLQRWQARGRPHLSHDAQQPWLSLATGDGIADSPAQALLRGRDLEPQREAHAQALCQSPAQVDTTQLQPPLGEFVASLARTLDQCQRGVFIWNLEPYDDVHVEDTHVKQAQPLRALYCVAAGFKPNAILRSHGYTADTEVVFFDYSGEALAFRRLLIEHWDGYDLPSFLLPRLNPAETHYWLRSTARGQMPERDELVGEFDQLWARELEDWGGADAFAEQWNATRRLRHRFVEVDLLQAPEIALGTPPEGPALVWWSNAFSSVHALWNLRHAERLHAFSRWIEVIAERCPQAWLLGADANNCPVGGIQAAAYASLLSAWQGGLHEPLPASARAMRF